MKSSNFIQNHYFTLGFIIICVGLLVRLFQISTFELSYFDEGAYMLEAAKMLGREPSMDFYYARPGYAFFLGIMRILVEPPLIAGRLLSALGFFALGLVLLFPVRRILGSPTTLVALCYVSLMALHVYYSRLIFPDTVVTALLFAALAFHVISEQIDSLSLAFFVGILMGFTILSGSYRIGPTLIGLLGVYAYTAWKAGFTYAKLRRFLATLFATFLLVLFFDNKFDFFNQIKNVLTASALTRDKNIEKFQPDFLFFLFVLALTTAVFVVIFSVTADWLKNRDRFKFLHQNESAKYFVHLLWAVVLAPIVFHSFYYLRAPKVFSTALPAIAIFMAIYTMRISASRAKIVTFSCTLLISLIQCIFVLETMGVEQSTRFFNRLGTLPGTVSYGNALSVKAFTKVSDETNVVLGWDCAWRPESCNPDFKVVSPTEHSGLSAEEKSKWMIYETWNLRYRYWGSLLYHLETYDSSPQTILRSFEPNFFIEYSLPWLILKRKSVNE